MNLKDAAANLNQAHPEDILHPLYTPWGEMMMRSGSYDDILSEYPRPQMKRTDYHTLNGLWEYAFVPADGSSSSEDPAYFTAQGSIRVPFSPEALLSGVHRRLEPTEYLWYHRELSFTTEELSQKEETMRCILHFDAVDQEATVFLGTKRHSQRGLPSFFLRHHRICKRRSGISLCKSPGSDRHRLRHQGKADPEPRRHVLHCPERHLAECLVRMGSGKLCDQL